VLNAIFGTNLLILAGNSYNGTYDSRIFVQMNTNNKLI
jgi:hypothetical protein